MEDAQCSQMKACSQCREVLSVRYFYKERPSRGGLQAACKHCHKASVYVRRERRRLARIDAESAKYASLAWRPIGRYPAYEVSEYGDVRRIARAKGGTLGKVLKKKWHVFGYPRYDLYHEGRAYGVEAHKLVAWTFLGEPPFVGAEVAHKDGNPQNNHYTNLVWKTHKANEADKAVHGTAPVGESNPNAKLTWAMVKEIRVKYATGNYTLCHLAAVYPVTFQNVGKIVREERWKE